MFDVDHILPQKWGGLDHPRNYVVMHRSMNRSFKECLPEAKFSYIERRSDTVLRKVNEFTKDVLQSTQVQNAIKDYIENHMRPW